MTLQEYFQQPEALRILLIEVTRNDALATKYFLADDNYITKPTDTPPNVEYSAIISGSGLGDIRRSINDPFTGNASTGFGTITLANSNATSFSGGVYSEQPINLVRGASVSAYLTGPIEQFDRVDAIELLTGKVARTGGDSDGNYTFEVTDGSELIRNKTITVDQFPISYGLVRNITPKLTNPALLEYYVHDGPIESVDAVYDQGALLSPSQYTVDLATGKLTLLVNPIGQLTADVKGAKVGGIWLQSTQQIISDLLARAGVILGQDILLPPDLIGLYLDRSQSLGGLLNQLVVGCAGYWLVSANNVFRARQFPVPQETVAIATYTDAELIESVSYTDEDRLYNTINYSYRKNWTQYQSRGGATPEQAAFSQKEYEQAFVADPVPLEEVEYQDSPQIDTLFDELNAAQNIAERVLSIYRQPRKIVSLSVPYSDTLRLGDNVGVLFDGLTFIGAITSLSDVFDGSYPIQRLEILA